MTLYDKRRCIVQYCSDTACKNCDLIGKNWKHRIPGKDCINVVSATNEEIDRAIAIIGAENIDVVNKAAHYNQGGIECIKAIEASMSPEEYAGFLKGQVVKYIWRYRHKGKPSEDLKKARYYLDELIRVTEEGAQA